MTMIMTSPFLFSDFHSMAEGSISIFTYNGGKFNWEQAKAVCENSGQRLAVLDSQAKISVLRQQDM